nr:MAG TPA: hypothetical protein [Inoviridae sp.]
MSDIYTWISTTAFPALGSCWDFFKDCISDLISVVTSSRLVFIFALFLIGTIISVIVLIVTSIPDVSNVDTSYPNFNLIKQRDLYFSGFHNPIRMFSKVHFKNKSKDIFKKNNLPYVTVGGYKFYNPNYKKNTNKFKAMEYDYFRSQKTAPKKRSANIDIEAD